MDIGIYIWTEKKIHVFYNYLLPFLKCISAARFILRNIDSLYFNASGNTSMFLEMKNKLKPTNKQLVDRSFLMSFKDEGADVVVV